MAKIVVRLPRYATINGEERTVAKRREWYVADPSKEYQTDIMIIPPDVLQQDGLHRIGKEELCVFAAQPIDEYLQLKREVQLITLKDLGFIAAYVGVHRKMVFAESGTGSGGATCFFAPLVDKVFSYDVRKEPSEKVQEDCAKLGIQNVTFGVGDVFVPEQIGCRDVDVFLLDVPEPWRAWETMKQCVKVGGWVVGYTPNASQLQQLVNIAPREFLHAHACELIERYWRVKGLVVRPDTADFSHTAFLSFFRKIY